MRLFALIALACAIAFPAHAQSQVSCPAPNPAAVCFQFPNAPIVNFSWTPAITTTPANLAATAAKAKAGDTILVAGAPAPVVLRNLSFAPPVTIASADPAHPGVIDGLQLIGDVGLTFDGLSFTLSHPLNQASNVVAVTNSSAITFKNPTVTGAMDPAGKCGWFGRGIVITGGDHVTISGGEHFNLYKGVTLAGGAFLTLQDALLHDIGTSAVDGGGDLAHLVFLRNTIRDLVPTCGHSDGWHLWSKNSSKPIDDILIRGNNFLYAKALGSPGIALEGTPFTVNGLANQPGFTHVVIDGNTLRWNENQGISTNWTQATITNNFLAPTPVLDSPSHAPAFIERQGSVFDIHGNTWKCGPSALKYPDNKCLTAKEIATYGGLP